MANETVTNKQEINKFVLDNGLAVILDQNNSSPVTDEDFAATLGIVNFHPTVPNQRVELRCGSVCLAYELSKSHGECLVLETLNPNRLTATQERHAIGSFFRRHHRDHERRHRIAGAVGGQLPRANVSSRFRHVLGQSVRKEQSCRLDQACHPRISRVTSRALAPTRPRAYAYARPTSHE